MQRGSEAQREVTMAQRALNLFMYLCMRYCPFPTGTGRAAADFPVGTPEEVSTAWRSYSEVKKHVCRATKLEDETFLRKRELGLENGALADDEKRTIMRRLDKRLDMPSVKPADEDEVVLWHEAQALLAEKVVIEKETVELYNEYERISPLEHDKKFKEQWELVQEVFVLHVRTIRHVKSYNRSGKTFTTNLSNWRRAHGIIAKLWTGFAEIFYADTPMESFEVPSADRYFEMLVCKPDADRAMAARLVEGFEVASQEWLDEYGLNPQKMETYQLLQAQKKFASKLNAMERGMIL
jgi:hypothetical protein